MSSVDREQREHGAQDKFQPSIFEEGLVHVVRANALCGDLVDNFEGSWRPMTPATSWASSSLPGRRAARDERSIVEFIDSHRIKAPKRRSR